jgi:hypothetical protein
MRFRHSITVVLRVLLTAAFFAPSASADVDGGGFDGLPLGPYPFGGGSPRLLLGDPLCIKIIQAGTESGAPSVPGGSVHVLCIDGRFKDSNQILEFDFACEINPAGVCQVKYDFSAASYIDGAGFDVVIDADGDYSDTDATWHPPVIFPPSTLEGSNTEGVGVCEGSTHTITFVVNPGVVMYLDNLRTVCTEGTVSSDASSWGRVKALYR